MKEKWIEMTQLELIVYKMLTYNVMGIALLMQNAKQTFDFKRIIVSSTGHIVVVEQGNM